MPAALRPYLTAGLALTIAGATAVSPPVAPRPGAVDATQLSTVLTAGESLLNVPLNLVQNIVNVPYYEVQALNLMAQSLLFTGPWFVGSPTNVWGEDPGDPGHFESLLQLAVPFPALSGAGHEDDLTYPGLGQQLAGLAAVEIPANPSCATFDCLPMIPTSPITGLTWVDQFLWTAMIATFVQKMPVIDNWFQVPLSAVTTGDGYYFDPAAPGSIASGPAYSYPGFPWPGTQTGTAEDGTVQYLMPWAGTHFKLDPVAPFQNFGNSLQEPFDVNNFHLPDLVEFARVVQALAAGAFLDFNPFVTGSPLCPGPCVLPGDEQLYHAVISAIDKLWPGNTSLETWLTMYDNGTANVSTPEIVDYLTWAWRQQTVFTDFSNELQPPYANDLPPDPAIDTSAFLPTLAEVNGWVAANFGEFTQSLLDNSGILGPFDYVALWDLFFPPA